MQLKIISFIIFAVIMRASVLNAQASLNFGISSNRNPNSVQTSLTKSIGWLIGGNQQRYSVDSNGSQGLLTSHLEILRLLEILLQFKGEVASRTRALISDNSDLIRSVYNTVMNKLGHLNNFTLAGIRILRSILEFGMNAMQNWPSVPQSSPSSTVESNSKVVIASTNPVNFVRSDYYY